MHNEKISAEGERKNWSLIPIKNKFTKITSKQVEDFKEAVHDLTGEFQERGPLSVGNDMAKGSELLKTFRKSLNEKIAVKEELVMDGMLSALAQAFLSQNNTKTSLKLSIRDKTGENYSRQIMQIAMNLNFAQRKDFSRR